MTATLLNFGTDLIRGSVAPEYGGSLSSLQFRIGDRWVDIFQHCTADEVTTGKKAYFIMGPPTARTRLNHFPFQGRPFSLGNLGHTHGLHGFIPKAKFAVGECSASSVQLRLNQKDQPFPYPGDHTISICYTGQGNRLIVDFYAENNSDVTTPFCGGSHPMILKRVAGSKQDFKLKFTATEHFKGDPLQPENYLPTGEMEAVIGGPRDYSEWKVGATGCDSTYGGWDGHVAAEWEDVGVLLRGGVLSGPSKLLHYWNSPTRDIWAFEPLVACADALNLEPAGFKNTGLVWLKPGEHLRWTHWFEVSLSA